MSDSLARLGPYSDYADLMTPDEYASMMARVRQDRNRCSAPTLSSPP